MGVTQILKLHHLATMVITENILDMHVWNKLPSLLNPMQGYIIKKIPIMDKNMINKKYN